MAFRRARFALLKPVKRATLASQPPGIWRISVEGRAAMSAAPGHKPIVHFVGSIPLPENPSPV